MTRTYFRPALGLMLTEGVGVVRRFPGLLLTLYVLELFVSVIAGWLTARILAAAFARMPVFDQAVDGDISALVFAMREWHEIFGIIAWVCIGVVLTYMLLSLYLWGGLNAVLLQRPTKRREVAKTFGAGGAATFYAYLRVFLWSLVPYVIIFIVLAVGLGRAGERLETALTGRDVAAALLPGLLPAMALWWVQSAAVDYARIGLSRAPGMSSWRALWQGYRTVFMDWRPLVHLLLYVLFFALVTTAFVLFTFGLPMAGTFGAVAMFVIRQLVSMLRFISKIVCAGGQVAYARRRPARAEPMVSRTPPPEGMMMA